MTESQVFHLRHPSFVATSTHKQTWRHRFLCAAAVTQGAVSRSPEDVGTKNNAVDAWERKAALRLSLPGVAVVRTALRCDGPLGQNAHKPKVARPQTIRTCYDSEHGFR
jgi:hypothetical protein